MLVPRILVVEDETAAAIDLREQLMHLGYEVSYLVATDDRALRTMKQSRTDLILMDISVNAGSEDVAPVVWLTARPDEATAVGARNEPAPICQPEPHRVIQVTFARRQVASHFLRAGASWPGTDGLAASATGDNAPRLEWRKSHDSVYASMASRVDQDPYHLVVERLPSRGAWDWAVWRSGDSPETALHGRASSKGGAMAAAEAAAAERRDMEAARSMPLREARG